MKRSPAGSIAHWLLFRFSALQYANFRYFLVGQSISLVGSWMQKTAQQWLLYTLTDSPLMLGLLGVCQFGPALCFSLPAGVYVDRWPKRRMLLLTQGIQMVQALLLALLVGFGAVRCWHVFVLAALLGFAQTFDMPVRQSFFIELVGRESLPNAIGLNSTIVNIARIAGPALAGIIMAGFDIAACFMLNALSFAAVIYSLLRIESYAVNIRPREQNLRREVMDGLQYIGEQKQILYAVGITLAIGTFAMNHEVIVPVFARVILQKNAQGYSLLLSAIGAGALFGSLYFAARSRSVPPADRIALNALALGICLLLAGLTRNYLLSLLVLSGLGFFNMQFMCTVNSLMQLRVSDEYRGRVMSVYALVLSGTTPFGNLFAGWTAQLFGPANSFLLCGMITLLLLAFIHGRLREKAAGTQEKTRPPEPGFSE